MTCVSRKWVQDMEPVGRLIYTGDMAPVRTVNSLIKREWGIELNYSIEQYKAQGHHVFEVMDLHEESYDVILGIDFIKKICWDEQREALVIYANNGRSHSSPNHSSSVSSSSSSHHVNTITDDHASSAHIPPAPYILYNNSRDNNVKVVGRNNDDGEDLPEVLEPERLHCATDEACSEEYEQGRARIMLQLQPLLEVNEGIRGWCNLPYASLSLQLRPCKDNETTYKHQYPLAETAMQMAQPIIDRWLAEDRIETVDGGTTFNSPMLCVPKKDENGRPTAVRLCFDGRNINRFLTGVAEYPIPNIRSELQDFAGCKFFGQVDLSDAYTQIPLDEASRPVTSFMWRGKQYRFKCAIYGLKPVSSHFQRLMAALFGIFPSLSLSSTTCPLHPGRGRSTRSTPGSSSSGSTARTFGSSHRRYRWDTRACTALGT